MKKDRIYICNDIETSGSLVGYHSILSWGACVVTEEALSTEELKSQGLVYYDELAPISEHYEIEAMRISCLGLRSLGFNKDNLEDQCNPLSPRFDPGIAMFRLRQRATPAGAATYKFEEWINKVSAGRRAELVTDTVIFDASHLSYYFSRFTQSTPYGHTGLDLDSFYRGFCKNRQARLRELEIKDDRKVPHCAEDDAIYLAKIARELFYTHSVT